MTGSLTTATSPPSERREHTEEGSRRPSTRLSGVLRTAWLVGCAGFALQLAGLTAWSWHLWSRFDLTDDMAAYAQAWHQIATGHLDPYLTVFPYHYPHYGYPFLQSHLELAMWPLALLYWAWPHAVDLLLVQDAALAGAGLVAYRWGLEHVERHWDERRTVLLPAAVLLAVLLISPWTYWAASFDFHLETVAAFFLMLAGRDLWAGSRRAWAWAGVVLLCGDVAATYLVALGLAAVVSGPRLRARGGVLMAAGLAWLGLVGLLHSGKGSSLAAGYGYLAHHSVAPGLAGVAAIVAGALTHPGTVRHVLAQRFDDLFKYVAGAGTAGAASPIGAALVVLVLLPAALNANPGFLATGAFQALVAVLGVAVGTVALMSWLRRRRWRWIGSLLALAVGIGAVTQVAVVSAQRLPGASRTFARVSPAAARELAAVLRQVPARDEAIVSQGVIGRFGTRRLVYPILVDGQRFPLHGRTVAVVLVPRQGIEPIPPRATEAAVAELHRLGARQIADGHGVSAFLWRVPPGRHRLTFPP